ncbi:hypothetical protein VNI00_011925 [Paramarasmius palmivorus]|uniref:Uncharacterized protein n=1 Tax=Paramarasmius palmivorus TaxID=297713 RepID=A0AAW0CAE7_9AGAR
MQDYRLLAQLRELASLFSTVRRLFESSDVKVTQSADFALQLRMSVLHRALYQDSWSSLMHSVSQLIFGFTPSYDLSSTLCPVPSWDSNHAVSTDGWSLSDSPTGNHAEFIHFDSSTTFSTLDDWERLLHAFDSSTNDGGVPSSCQETSPPSTSLASSGLPSFQFLLTAPTRCDPPAGDSDTPNRCINVVHDMSNNNPPTKAQVSVSLDPAGLKASGTALRITSQSTRAGRSSSLGDVSIIQFDGEPVRTTRKRARLSDATAEEIEEDDKPQLRRSKRLRLSSYNSPGVTSDAGRRSASLKMCKRDKENLD